MPLPLSIGGDSDVFQQQMIVGWNQDQQSHELAAVLGDPCLAPGYDVVVVGGHGRRFTTDSRHVVRVGVAGHSSHGLGVFNPNRPQKQACAHMSVQAL
jgi:hypothetical protein